VIHPTKNNEKHQEKINEQYRKLRENQSVLDRYIAEQTKYYYLILLKGFDVRKEGLSWIIRK
jgi:hypothetical protein